MAEADDPQHPTSSQRRPGRLTIHLNGTSCRRCGEVIRQFKRGMCRSCYQQWWIALPKGPTRARTAYPPIPPSRVYEELVALIGDHPRASGSYYLLEKLLGRADPTGYRDATTPHSHVVGAASDSSRRGARSVTEDKAGTPSSTTTPEDIERQGEAPRSGYPVEKTDKLQHPTMSSGGRNREAPTA